MLTNKNPQPPYDYPEAGEQIEGIYQHICPYCGHLFFGYKGRRRLPCNFCREKKIQHRDTLPPE